MNVNRKTELDPFRAILAAISGANNSDTLVQAANFAGVRFDGMLSERDSHMHSAMMKRPAGT